MSKITFRSIIEVLGKPKEHVESTFNNYIVKLKQDSKYKVLSEEYAEIRQQEGVELWSTFVEMELETDNLPHIMAFCFEYMPSIIEIIGPEQLNFTDVEASTFLSEMQGKIHNIDMIAKQLKLENEHIMKNMSLLLRNYIQVLLGSRGQMTSEQLAKLTGVPLEKVEDFLDKLIDEKKVDLKEGVYFLIKENGKENGN
jgi:hypothetical protein